MEWKELKQLQEGPAEEFVDALADGLQLSWPMLLEVVAALNDQLVLRQETRLCKLAECQVEDCSLVPECWEADLIANDLRDNINKARRAHEYHQRRAHRLELDMEKVKL